MPYGPDPADLARLDPSARRALVLTWRLFAAGVVLGAVGGGGALVLHGAAARAALVVLGVGLGSLAVAVFRAGRAGYRIEPGPTEREGAAPPEEDGP